MSSPVCSYFTPLNDSNGYIADDVTEVEFRLITPNANLFLKIENEDDFTKAFY